jgi:hypothetical protein
MQRTLTAQLGAGESVSIFVSVKATLVMHVRATLGRSRSPQTLIIWHTTPRISTTSKPPIQTFSTKPTANMIENAMDDATLKQYLADDPPTVVPLAIKPHFDALNDKEKKYAHYISRASFAGTRVNLRYVHLQTMATASLT